MVVQVKDLLRDETLKKAYVIMSKRKTRFSYDLKMVPKFKATIARYIAKDRGIGNIKIRVLPNFPNAFYDYKKDEFAIGIFNPFILAHEFEHYLSLKEAHLYKKVITTSKMLSSVTGKLGLPAALASLSKGSISGEVDKNINNTLDALSVAHGVSSAPTLYEEGKANLNAILSSKDKWKATKTLAPAYSSYIQNATTPIAIYQLAKHLNNE